MNTPKAAYWFALALFAVALHSEYQRGAFPVLHRAASRAGSTLCRLSTKAERTVAMARLIVGRPARSTDALVAGLDGQLADARRAARDGAEMAREETQDRAEMLRDQMGDRVRDQIQDRFRDRVRGQAGMVRAQMELRSAQIQKIRVLRQAQVRISAAVDRPVVSIGSGGCAQSAIRVERPSIDLRMDDSADDDADSR